MVTKKKDVSEAEEAQGKIKVSKLNLTKETVKELADAESKNVKGGARPRGASANSCSPTCDGSYTCPS